MAGIKDIKFDTKFRLSEHGTLVHLETVRDPIIYTSNEPLFKYANDRGCTEVQMPNYFTEYPYKVKQELAINILELWSKYAENDEANEERKPTRYDWMRSKMFIGTQRRINRNLRDSVERVKRTGLVDEYDLEDSYFTWFRRAYWRRLGTCYTGQRIVAINPILDYRAFSQRVLDEVVYHEILHLRQQRNGHSSRVYHNKQFREWERQFPEFDDIKREICSTPFPDISDRRNPPLDMVPNGTTFGNEDAYMTEGGKPALDLSEFYRFSEPEEQIYVSFCRTDSTGCYYAIRHHPASGSCLGIMEIQLDARLLGVQSYITELVSKDIVRYMNFGEMRQNPTVLEHLWNVYNPNARPDDSYRQMSLDDVLSNPATVKV